MLILVSVAKRSDCPIRKHLNLLLEYIDLVEAFQLLSGATQQYNIAA